jgi:SRSO17 transposase
MAAAYVPPDTGCATRPALALALLALIDRARGAGVPFAWIAADGVHGAGEVERASRRAGEGHGRGVDATRRFNSRGARPPVAGTAAGIAGALDPCPWRRPSAGAGGKGER